MCSSISRPWRDSWSLGEKGEGSPNASEVLWGGKIFYSPRALFSGLWGGGGGGSPASQTRNRFLE